MRSSPFPSVNQRLVKIVVAFDKPISWAHKISVVDCDVPSWGLDIRSLQATCELHVIARENAATTHCDVSQTIVEYVIRLQRLRLEEEQEQGGQTGEVDGRGCPADRARHNVHIRRANSKLHAEQRNNIEERNATFPRGGLAWLLKARRGDV